MFVRIPHERHARQAGDIIFQNLQPLSDEVGCQLRVSSDVSLWWGGLGQKPRRPRTAGANQDGGIGGGGWGAPPRRGGAVADEDVPRQRDKLERGPPQEIDVALRSAIFKGDVLAHHVAIIAQALPEVIPYRGNFITNDADARNTRRLAASRERPQ